MTHSKTKYYKTIKIKHKHGTLFQRHHRNEFLSKILKFLGNPFFLLLVSVIKVPKSILTQVKLISIRLKLFFLHKSSKIHKRSSHKKHTLLYTVLIGLTISAGILFSLFYIKIFKDLPHPKTLTNRQVSLTTKIYDRNHKLLYKIYKNENRTLVKLKDIPPNFVHAILSAEDKDFYSHHGISIKGVIRATYLNWKQEKLSGGSTITQQLVKNALLSPEKTYTRKLKEAVLSLWTETYFTKDQILEMYLNEVGFGGSTYGIEEAAQYYFGKSVTQLGLAEAALLAGLPASPTSYSPFGENPDFAKTRQLEVLNLMYTNKYITQEQLEAAKLEHLNFVSPKNEIQAPHFVMYIRSLLAQKYGEELIERGGLEVTTSLDLDLNNLAQQIVMEDIDSLSKLRITNGAALITRPNTGEILAMIGSRNYFDIPHQGNFNVTTAQRQPGSSIKPIMYSLALENGFTPATLLDDSPTAFNTPGQPPYIPQNYDHRFHGKVPLRIALASSYNIPAVKTLNTVGVERFIKHARDMGITTWTDPGKYGLSLTLGGGEVKMTELSTAYNTIANLGVRVDLHPILKVIDSKGQILEEYNCIGNQSASCPGIQVLNPGVAYQLIDILSDNLARSPAFGLHSTLVIPGKHVAVKTGTSNNLKDNWTVGFTPDYLVSVWVGNNDSSPMSYVASGITGASSIWQKIMYALTKDKPDKTYSPPKELERVEVCSLTGTRSCSECPNKRVEYFLPATAPKFACTTDQIIDIEIQQSQSEEPEN